MRLLTFTPLSRDENLYSMMFESHFYIIFPQYVFKRGGEGQGKVEEKEEISREK